MPHCMRTQRVLVRRRVGDKHQSTATPWRAQSPGGRGTHMRCKAPRSHRGDREQEQKALERARRSRCCREEQKAVGAQHGELTWARPRPPARRGC